MTSAPSLVGLFVAPLNRADIEYMVTGGLAAIVYGHPRLTLDVAAWALGRRVVRVVQGESVQFAPIEYVILSKLRYFRDGRSDRHLRDIVRMLEVSGSEVNRPTLEARVERLNLAREWTQARSLDGAE